MSGTPSSGPEPGSRLALPGPSRQVAADLVVIAVFAVALLTSRDFAPVAVWFPTAVGIVGIVAGAGKLAVDLRALRQERAAAGRPAPPEPSPEPAAGEPARQPADLVPPPLTADGRRELLIWLGLLAGMLVLIQVIGMVPTAAVWLPAVLWWRGRRSLWLAGGGAVGVVMLLMLMEAQLHVRWPEPVLDIYGMLT